MKKFIGVAVIIFIAIQGWAIASAADAPSQDRQVTIEKLQALQSSETSISEIKPPKIPQPKWYKKQVEAEQKASQKSQRSGGGSKTFTYSVKTEGKTVSNLAEFSAMANQTLNSSRGWAQLGLTFKQVPSGGNFNLVLAEASRVGSRAGCSAEWSCRVGVSVIINDDRWQGATSAWNKAGGDIRGYRHMVINHEVGHWLGHDHAKCSAKSAYAPVMLQQSISLQGCKFNPWPLTGELWSSR